VAEEVKAKARDIELCCTDVQ